MEGETGQRKEERQRDTDRQGHFTDVYIESGALTDDKSQLVRFYPAIYRNQMVARLMAALNFSSMRGGQRKIRVYSQGIDQNVGCGFHLKEKRGL